MYIYNIAKPIERLKRDLHLETVKKNLTLSSQ